MAAIGIILKNGLELTGRLPKQRRDPWKSQKSVLFKLLSRAELTLFGQEYGFGRILRSPDFVEEFQATVPLSNYESMMRWWKMSLEGEDSVTWPGKVEHFALSSGTSSGASKYIPVTRAMRKAIQRASIKQIGSLAYCDLPQSFFETGILMLGGSTNLEYNGIFYAGDLSGITTGNLPFWFQPFYKPGKEISSTKSWQEKLDVITTQAHKWDIGAIVGVPSWFQLLLERIVEYNKVSNIHEVWPNLQVFTHGGVAFEPYRKGFEPLLGKPLIYLETYLASEGFIAYQRHPDAEGMALLVRNGIFFEFVPFTPANVDSDGNIRETAEVLTLNEVKEGVDYAILLSTVSGAWRYAIGDVVRFTSVENYEIRITGRTKHFLSLVGEHLSVDNMNRAIEMLNEDLNLGIREFTVAGINSGTRFAHHWFIGAAKEISNERLTEELDKRLKLVNDDYAVERQHALHKIYADVVPHEHFMGYLKSIGREGAQIKFPRVIKEAQLESFEQYLQRHNIPFTPSSQI